VVLGSGTNPLLVTNTALTTINGVVTGSGTLVKAGTGTLVLTGSNLYTGTTNINQGILNIQNSSALGVAGGGTIVANGATLQLQAPTGSSLALTEPLTLNGAGATAQGATGALENVLGANTLSTTTVFTPLVLATPSTIAVDAGSLSQVVGTVGTSNVGSLISGPGDLTKVGGGTFALTANNLYTGQTNINNGVVTINTSQYALGSIVGGTVVNSGGTLQALASGGIFQTETLTLSGTGFAGANLAGAFVAVRQLGRHPDPAGRRQQQRHRGPDQGRRRQPDPPGGQ
jgi:autotransporter-associated beta strand protein